MMMLILIAMKILAASVTQYANMTSVLMCSLSFIYSRGFMKIRTQPCEPTTDQSEPQSFLLFLCHGSSRVGLVCVFNLSLSWDFELFTTE